MILNDLLDKHGPSATPRGEWSWVLELPLAPENLLLSASLVCAESQLRASVYQKESPSSWSDETLAATWTPVDGAWVFQEAHVDGQPATETAAIRGFAKYLDAMGVEAVFNEPMVMHAPRRKMGAR